MKLLKVIKMENAIDYAEDIRLCLEDRLDWLQDREPEYYGSVYDDWQDKSDDMEAIIDMFDDMKDEHDEETFKNIVAEIESYQWTYGGLSRLIV